MLSAQRSSPSLTRSPSPPPTRPATPRTLSPPNQTHGSNGTDDNGLPVPADPPELQGSRRVWYRVFSRTLHGKIGRYPDKLLPIPGGRRRGSNSGRVTEVPDAQLYCKLKDGLVTPMNFKITTRAALQKPTTTCVRLPQ